MAKHFTRRIEDFVCEKCGAEVKGNGYTNHCPYCLYSKHVDVNPGDRAASCGGLMEPISIENGRKGFVITSRCQKCNHEKKNRVSSDDNMDKIIEISTGHAQKRR